MNTAPDKVLPSRWLAKLANLTVVAVCPLLVLGALVTTLRVGMADSRAVVAPHRAIAEFASEERALGWKIEHSHRLAGWFAGMCGIALAISFFRCERRRGFRWLGLGVLLFICVQGLLGIFRVHLNAWWGSGLAWIHGSFAQLVFAFLVGTAYVVSSAWSKLPTESAPQRLRRGSLLVVALLFVQLVLGGVVRHQANLAMIRLHMLGAFATLAALLWLAKAVFDDGRRVGAATWLLLGLVALQILLGVEAAIPWFARQVDPSLAIRESVGVLATRTAHYFVGSLLFATTVVIALKMQRGWLPETVTTGADAPALPAPAGWEGAV